MVSSSVQDMEMIHFATFCNLQEKVPYTERLRPVSLRFQYVVFT